MHDPVDIHFHYMLPEVFTHPQMDTLVDVHGRSHSFLLIHPREVLLAWHWVIARPLSSHGIVLLSLPLGSGLNWGGTGISVPCLVDTHTQGNTSFWCDEGGSQLWCRMHDCTHVGSVTSYKGMSTAIWCTTSWGFILPSVFNLPLSLKGISLH